MANNVQNGSFQRRRAQLKKGKVKERRVDKKSRRFISKGIEDIYRRGYTFGYFGSGREYEIKKIQWIMHCLMEFVRIPTQYEETMFRDTTFPLHLVGGKKPKRGD